MIAPMVVLSVGTDHHPFQRLVDWVAQWSLDHPHTKVVIQRGSVAGPPNMESHELIPHPELRELFRSATAVVSHGGPSTVMDARMAGKLPIVVPRNPDLGEHVDGHQLRFAEHLGRYGLARVAHTEEDLRAALATALATPEEFEIPLAETEASAGVVQFGQVMDNLLGVNTKLRLYDLSGSDEREAQRRQAEDRRRRNRRAGKGADS